MANLWPKGSLAKRLFPPAVKKRWAIAFELRQPLRSVGSGACFRPFWCWLVPGVDPSGAAWRYRIWTSSYLAPEVADPQFQNHGAPLCRVPSGLKLCRSRPHCMSPMRTQAIGDVGIARQRPMSRLVNLLGSAWPVVAEVSMTPATQWRRWPTEALGCICPMVMVVLRRALHGGEEGEDSSQEVHRLTLAMERWQSQSTRQLTQS